MTQREHLLAEIGTLKGFLEKLPLGRVLERRGFERRLLKVQAELAEVEARPQSYPLTLAFRGAPVDGMRSIDATFATKAVRAFVEAAETVTASRINEALGGRGPLPGGRDRGLRIVQTVEGSFGFELELPPASDPQTSLLPDPHVQAIEDTLKLLTAAARDDDETFSERVADLPSRAIEKVRAFAEVLRDSKALFAAAFSGTEVRLDCADEVEHAVSALSPGNVSETVEHHVGTLTGVLPESRLFEVSLKDGGQILKGKVERGVDIGALKAQWLDQEARLELRVVRVGTRARYLLKAATEV